MVRIQVGEDQGVGSAASKPLIVYFSSVSGYTKRFVDNLGGGLRIPLMPSEPTPIVTEPYVLITPSYGAGRDQETVPKQVIKFLNIEQNRSLLLGVVGSGSTHYREKYCRAAFTVAAKCGVPVLYTYELFGLPEDVADVDAILRGIYAEKANTGPIECTIEPVE